MPFPFGSSIDIENTKQEIKKLVTNTESNNILKYTLYIRNNNDTGTYKSLQLYNGNGNSKSNTRNNILVNVSSEIRRNCYNLKLNNYDFNNIITIKKLIEKRISIIKCIVKQYNMRVNYGLTINLTLMK